MTRSKLSKKTRQRVKKTIKVETATEARIRRQKARLIKIIYDTPVRATACKKADVSRATFYRWYEEDAVFAKEFDLSLGKGRELVNDIADSHVIRGVHEGDFTFIKYWKSFNDQRYHPKYRPKESEVIRTLSQEAKNKIDKLLRSLLSFSSRTEGDFLERSKK